MAIREYFTSRYKDGFMVEVDYSQLEIYVLAFLSGDKQLRSDLLSGKDLHGINAEALFGPSYTKEQRTFAKRMSFQLQYGAGYASMAEKLGLDEDITKKFIENYYSRYTGVKQWQDYQLNTAVAKRKPSKRRTANNRPAGIYTRRSTTGRRYTYYETDSPNWMRSDTSFNPPTLKNYPVQGLATGDIVPAMLGVLYKRLKDSGLRAKMVNTVHDSIMFDCPKEELDKLCALIYGTLSTTKDMINKLYPDLYFDLELPFEIEYGKNLHEMEKYLLTRFE